MDENMDNVSMNEESVKEETGTSVNWKAVFGVGLGITALTTGVILVIKKVKPYVERKKAERQLAKAQKKSEQE